MRKIYLMAMCALLTACGIHYYVKSQAQQFSELAAQVSTEVLKVPTELQALELDVHANLLRADRSCAAANGEILASRLVVVEGAIINPQVFRCPKARDTLADCISGRSCAICSQNTKACHQLRELASKTKYCVHQDVAAALSSTCKEKDGGGLWTREPLYSNRTDAAYKAYTAVTEVASAGAAYVSSLSSLSVDRKEGAAKYVSESTKQLEDAVKKLDEVAGTQLAPDAEAQKTVNAVKALAGILTELKMVRDDADAIRKLVRERGPDFESSMTQLSLSADFLQKTYYQTLLDTQSATLTASLRDPSVTMTDGDAMESQIRINELRRKRDQLAKTKPISTVIQKTVEAHRDLRRIAAGELTREERESVMQENIRQFSRLIQAIRDVTSSL